MCERNWMPRSLSELIRSLHSSSGTVATRLLASTIVSRVKELPSRLLFIPAVGSELRHR